MGTLAEILAVHADREVAEAAIDRAFERLRWVDAAMSRFREDSDIGRVNRYAAKDAVAIHPATADVIREALRWAEASDGAFDPGVARLVELWDVAHRTAPPAEPEFARLAGRRLHRGVGLDAWRGRPVVRYAEQDIGMDLGGIAKGYAVDAAIAALRAEGIRHAVVSAGGDLRAIGRSADGDPWRVGIRNPASPSGIIGEIEVRDRAIATSGDYLQGFEHEGRRYHHILDPETGAPRRSADHSVTIMAPTCLLADAAATTVFGLTPATRRAMLERVGQEVSVVG